MTSLTHAVMHLFYILYTSYSLFLYPAKDTPDYVIASLRNLTHVIVLSCTTICFVSLFILHHHYSVTCSFKFISTLYCCET